MNFRFQKSEKLKSRKTIELLFKEGKSVSKFPVKLLYLPVENNKITQVGFTVPKRNFKNAVDRNRIKRQLREAYRLQKHLLKSEDGSKFALFFLYLGKDKLPYQSIESGMRKLLEKIN